MKSLQNFLIKIEIIDSILGLIGIAIILSAGLFMQLFYGEEPCFLCLLQRLALLNIGIALLLNMKYGVKVSHWALVILSASVGIAISIRQILLHVNDPVGFCAPVLGLHLYSWCFIAFAIAIVGSAIMLIIYPENVRSQNNK